MTSPALLGWWDKVAPGESPIHARAEIQPLAGAGVSAEGSGKGWEAGVEIWGGVLWAGKCLFPIWSLDGPIFPERATQGAEGTYSEVVLGLATSASWGRSPHA